MIKQSECPLEHRIESLPLRGLVPKLDITLDLPPGMLYNVVRGQVMLLVTVEWSIAQM